MEENNPAPTVMTVVDSNLNKDDGEKEILNEEDAPKKITEESDPPCSVQESDGEDKEDDVEVVIIGDVDNKTIELDEDSTDETQMNLDRRSDELSTVANDSFKRATEFVIVNAANVSAEATEVTAPIEALQIKDELAETITAEVNTNDILENDPMDLLELNDRSVSTSSTRSHDGTDDYGDDVSSIGSSSVQTGSSSTSNLDWIKDHPWLLYEEGEEPFGYCLYCDAKINTKSQSSVKQHGTSLYHKERCENYLAFRDEEERNGLSMKLVEVKEEFGTDSRVEALKLKRKSQSGALNNFNWRRWLEDYPWLERDSAEGTVGYCKYCQIHVNVEFSYLRDRHNEGAKHREAEKQYEEPNETNEKNETSNLPEEQQKEPAADSQSKTNQRWLEVVENEPNMSRCKVCGTKMFKNNFLRHLRTNLHEHNEKIYLQNLRTAEQKASDEESGKNQQSWKLYTKHHPWLVSDPTDASFAYCKYCEKRFVYGASAAKRATHENSSQHKQNEVDFKKRNINPDKEQTEKDIGKNVEKNSSEDYVERNDQEDKDEEEDNEEEEESSEDDEDEDVDEDENEQANEDDKSEQEKESEEENESKKRVYKLTDEWINQYSWCKRHNKDPKNFFFCIYCKIPLSVAYSRSKHQSTSFHISAEREFLNRQAKRQKLQERKQANESPFFEWAVPLRNNPKSYSCRYCRVRISKNYSKKQHASSKIHQINESIYKNNRRKSVRKDETANNEISQPAPEVVTEQTSAEATKKKQTFAKVIIKAPSTVTLIKKWQKKFPWLSYKRSELRSNYGHCKICETSLYIRSLKHVLRHVRSGRHVSISKAKKKQKVEKEDEDDDDGDDGDETSAKTIKKGPKEESQTPILQVDASDKNLTKQPTTISTAADEKSKKSPKSYNFKSTIAEMKKRFSWIEKSERPNYGSCRFCNINIPLKVLFLRNHSNSQKHRHCVINYSANDRKKGNRVTPQAINADSDDNDDDVMIVEENNEEILISEQDENWTVKSETMDEHEELDYLLQRSFNNIQNKSNMQRSNVRKSTNADEDQPAKRFKRSLSSRRLNNSNTSLVASLLTTPLTLASCLGPLIQQQIQQQTNTSQTSTNLSTMSSAEAQKTVAPAMAECENTFDLFFKSISETMKKLPVDLAAEGKLRVMQIICDLELQALKRQQQSVQSETSSINTSGGLSYQATSTSGGHNSGCNSSVINDLTAEQNGNCNETIITQINTNTDLSPPLTTHLTSTAVNSSSVEKTSSSSTSTPVIGVMDKNGLQTLHLKSSLSKQIPKSTVNTTTVTTVASTGIRCIPFKNLSQPATPDTSNTKITRIQVPITLPAQPQNSNPNPNAVNSSKNLINFRNIQITKRISNSPTSASASSGTNAASPHQQAVPSTMANNSPQRTFITNIQPQLQRWGCSVNGATSLHTPTSSTVNQLKQLSSQQTSTPVSKK